MTDESACQCGCDDVDHLKSLRFAIITLSDTRTLQEDRSGDRIVSLLQDDGHRVAARVVLSDDAEPLRRKILEFAGESSIDVIVTTGGTGIAPRDLAIDVIEDLLDVTLPGFGEQFRAISFAEIGPKAMLSRATAGRIGDTVLFALPGSTGAVTTAMNQCVLPIVKHAVVLSREQPSRAETEPRTRH